MIAHSFVVTATLNSLVSQMPPPLGDGTHASSAAQSAVVWHASPLWEARPADAPLLLLWQAAARTSAIETVLMSP
jgi:hypothetical protein